MKKLFHIFLDKFRINSSRSKNISLHIVLSFLYKGGGLTISFILVPILIQILDNTNYGIWLTLTSFMSWFKFFDIGLGNGLRNKLAEAIVAENYKEAKSYVSTAYFIIGLIGFILIILFLLINNFMDWTFVFNTKENLKNDLSILLPILFTFFIVELVLKLIINVNQAFQEHSINDKFIFFTRLFSLAIILWLSKTSKNSLLLFGTIYSLIPVLILIIFNMYGFNNKFKEIKPSINNFSTKYLKEITGLGFSFFITKVGAIILLSTDSFIISQIFSPSDVVPYNLTYKYFSILIIMYSILVYPYWSSFTEAFAKKDFLWIKKSVSTIQKIWLLIPLCLIIMILLSNTFFTFWIGDQVQIAKDLMFSMALFVLFYTYSQIHNQFINGVGKVRLHVYISLLIIFINIPLSIYFAKGLNLGLSGVILASSFCLIFKIILLPIQYKKIIEGNAIGIWNK